MTGSFHRGCLWMDANLRYLGEYPFSPLCSPTRTCSIKICHPVVFKREPARATKILPPPITTLLSSFDIFSKHDRCLLNNLTPSLRITAQKCLLVHTTLDLQLVFHLESPLARFHEIPQVTSWTRKQSRLLAPAVHFGYSTSYFISTICCVDRVSGLPVL